MGMVAIFTLSTMLTVTLIADLAEIHFFALALALARARARARSRLYYYYYHCCGIHFENKTLKIFCK
eukprot:SAG31_NODE_2252_length_6076_cov_2.828342_1_plen_66_part_10